jgi:hypothetical protein
MTTGTIRTTKAFGCSAIILSLPHSTAKPTRIVRFFIAFLVKLEFCVTKQRGANK